MKNYQNYENSFFSSIFDEKIPIFMCFVSKLRFSFINLYKNDENINHMKANCNPLTLWSTFSSFSFDEIMALLWANAIQNYILIIFSSNSDNENEILTILVISYQFWSFSHA